jgi:hypothetical protein
MNNPGYDRLSTEPGASFFIDRPEFSLLFSASKHPSFSWQNPERHRMASSSPFASLQRTPFHSPQANSDGLMPRRFNLSTPA